VNSENRVPCSFRGYRVRHGEKVSLGLRASPIVSCRSEKAAVTVAIPEFWQQFPKALTIEHGARHRLVLGLLPAQFDDPFELQGGEQKTHTVWLHFGLPSASGELPLAWVHQPVNIIIPPEWYVSSEAIPNLPSEPVQGVTDNRLDSLLTEALAGP